MNELVTIIITAYKVETYFERCITSVINQKYKNIEILLVVGDSDNGCVEIARKAAKIDARIRTIFAAPRGLSDARNRGLKEASGEFVTFIDGDDNVSEDYISSLVEKADEKDVDIVIGGYTRIEDAGETDVFPNGDKGKESGTNTLRKYLVERQEVMTVAWGKLYRRTLFQSNGIEYPISTLHEDSLTTYKLYDHACFVKYVEKPLYYYCIRNDSLSNARSIDREYSIIRCGIETLDYVNANRPECKYEAVNFYLFSIVTYILTTCNLQQNLGIDNKYLSKVSFGDVILNPKVLGKYKIMYLIGRISTSLLIKALRTYKTRGTRVER